jgi:glycosyltransferase involved in cell wall biosynthesis
MKRILIVSYHFPPDAEIGGLRATKFAKYLPSCGFEPIVLTVKPRYYPRIDKSRERDTAHLRVVHRTTMLPHSSKIYLALKRRVRRAPRHPEAAGTSTPEPEAKPTSISFARRAVFALESLPDDKQVWIPAAIARGLQITRRERIDWVLTTGPPMSAHLVGLALKRLTGVRWVADFRDPWINDYHRSLKINAVLRAHRWLEKSVLLAADRVVATTQRVAEQFAAIHPEIAAKSEMIPNGYDPDDFPGPEGSVERDPAVFTLTHAGTISSWRTAESLLEAVARLVDAGDLPRERIRIRFIGRSAATSSQAERLGLGDIVETTGFLDYDQSIQQLYASDLLLIFAQRQPLSVPGKLFDYLGTEKPILVLTGDGATADFTRDLKSTTVVDPDQPGHLDTKLRELWARFEAGDLAGGEPAATLARFRRGGQAEMLAAGLLRE